MGGVSGGIGAGAGGPGRQWIGGRGQWSVAGGEVSRGGEMDERRGGRPQGAPLQVFESAGRGGGPALRFWH